MKKILIVLLVACSAVLSGCQHIPLYDPSSGLYLRFEFDYASGDFAGGVNSAGVRFDDIVNGMWVMLYDHGTHELVHSQSLPAEGGFVDIGPGTYDCIAYSLGSEVIQTSGLRQRGEAYAYCERIGSSLTFSRRGAEGAEGEPGDAVANISFPIINEPDGLMCASEEGIYIPVINGAQQTVYVDMKVIPFVRDWTFEAVNVDGAENIRTLKCYVTGQLPGRYLWDARFGQDVCAIGFDVRYDSARSVITGSFNTFGKHPQALANVFLNIMVMNASGGYYQWIYDMTGQFDNPDNVERRLVVASPIVIPSSESGGYSPSVDDWNAEVVHVPLY